jgi:hypothetical protein
MRRKPGTDLNFRAQFAGNSASVPGFAPPDKLPARVSPKTVTHPSPAGEFLSDNQA